MSIFDKLRDNKESYKQELTANEKDVGRIINEIGTYFGADVYGARKTLDYLQSATGWVYSCVNAIADDIAGIRIKLMKFQGGEVVEVDTHPALDLLYRPNNVTTYFDLVKMTFQYLELTGEAPWFISFDKKAPTGIMLLRPDRLTIVPGTDGEMVKGYKYRTDTHKGSEEVMLEPFELIPLRYPNPNSPLRGMGPLSAAAETVDLDASSQEWNTSFFKNGATPSLVLETDKILSKEVRERLAARIKEKYEGATNAHKTMVLESGLKANKLTVSQKDMDFISQQTFSRDKILAIFRVPRTILGITDDVNRANAEASEYVFAKRTIKPKLEGFIQQLNEFLLPLFDKTGTLYFDYEDPVPQNVEQKIAQATAGVGTGFMTPNEARELFGLEPLEGGDELRDPVSSAPVFASNGSPVISKGVKKNRGKSERLAPLASNRLKHEATRKAVDNMKKTIAEKLTAIAYASLNQKRKKQKAIKAVKSFFTGTDDEKKLQKFSFQKKQLDVADDFEPKFIQKLNKVFESQKQDILERITENMKPGKKILDVEEERLRYEATMKATFMSLLKKQADEALKLIGQKSVKTKDLSLNQTLEKYFARRTFRFAGEVTRTTNELVAQALLSGIEAGESVPDLKRRISQLFNNMEEYRAERIARSETIRATNFAAEQAWVSSGVVEAKEWLTFRDERTDDECADMDGKIIPLEDSFFDKGDKMGNLNFDYENIEHPPLHVNCRCTLIPVVLPASEVGQWRPKMTESQALEFIKDSAVKDTWYHGTNDLAANAIQQAGFNLSSPNAILNNGLIDGIFLSDVKGRAEDYAMGAAGERGGKPRVLSVKINVKNLRKFDHDGLWNYAVRVLGRSRFTIDEVRRALLAEGVDAVMVNDGVIGQTYISVFDPKNVVVTEANPII